MSKVKLMTDTTSDIPVELSDALGIDVLSIPLAVGGKGYLERVDFTNEAFYDILVRSPEPPATARINAADYLERYRLAAEEGVTDLINVTINALGSGTNESAHMAAAQLQKEYPALAGGMRIHIIDSRSYSFGYGLPVVEAARRARAGDSVEEILAYINGWIDSAEIYLACFNLDFAKRSGRISSAAAFMGELLGLRPIIRMVDGQNTVVSKVRGDKNVVPALAELAAKAAVPGGEYVVMRAMLPEAGEELAALLTKKLGHAPWGTYSLGASVTINSGPQVVAAVVRGKNRAR